MPTTEPQPWFSDHHNLALTAAFMHSDDFNLASAEQEIQTDV